MVGNINMLSQLYEKETGPGQYSKDFAGTIPTLM
jgi:hypothetical protein